MTSRWHAGRGSRDLFLIQNSDSHCLTSSYRGKGFPVRATETWHLSNKNQPHTNTFCIPPTNPDLLGFRLFLSLPPPIPPRRHPLLSLRNLFISGTLTVPSLVMPSSGSMTCLSPDAPGYCNSLGGGPCLHTRTTFPSSPLKKFGRVVTSVWRRCRWVHWSIYSKEEDPAPGGTLTILALNQAPNCKCYCRPNRNWAE